MKNKLFTAEKAGVYYIEAGPEGFFIRLSDGEAVNIKQITSIEERLNAGHDRKTCECPTCEAKKYRHYID